MTALSDLIARLVKWPLDWWNDRRRKLDLEILWPSCCEQASDLNDAKAAFASHAFNDPAWMCLGYDEVCRRIYALKAREAAR